MGWYGMMGGTNRVGALEGAPEQAAVRGGDAQVLVQQGLEVRLGLVLVHDGEGGRWHAGGVRGPGIRE